MYRLIIFDMDGLMYDTERVMARAYLETTKEWGVRSEMADFMTLVGSDGKAICRRYHEMFGADFDAEGLYRASGLRKQEILTREGLPVKKGLRLLVDAAHEKGIPMAVASGSDADVVTRSLMETGYLSDFALAFSSQQVKRGKPFPDVFLEVCRQMEVDPADTLVLEDSPKGIRAALDGGMDVIAVPDIQPISRELKDSCQAVVESLDKVISYL